MDPSLGKPFKRNIPWEELITENNILLFFEDSNMDTIIEFLKEYEEYEGDNEFEYGKGTKCISLYELYDTISQDFEVYGNEYICRQILLSLFNRIFEKNTSIVSKIIWPRMVFRSLHLEYINEYSISRGKCIRNRDKRENETIYEIKKRIYI